MQLQTQYTPAELAEHLKIPERSVLTLIRGGKFPGAYKAGKPWRVPHEGLEKFKQSRKI